MRITGFKSRKRYPISFIGLLFITFGLRAQNVGIGTESPQAKLHVNGNQKIEGLHTLELGSGLTKDINAGKIGYKTFSNVGLDIVGAGTAASNRKIIFFGEGGSTFNGNVSLINGGKIILGTETPISSYAGSLLQLFSSTNEIRLIMQGANGGSNYNSIGMADNEGNSWLLNHKSQAWANNDHHLAFDYYNSSTQSYTQDAFKLTSTGQAGFGYDWNESPPGNAKVSVKGGDVFIHDLDAGVILKSPDGNCWRMTIGNDGNIITAGIPCPQ